MSDSSMGHIVAYVLPTWGHNKPLCALLARVIRLSQAHTTFFTGASMRDRVVSEINNQFLPEGEENLKSLFRVVGLPESKAPFDFASNKKAFEEAYKVLYDGRPIPATPDGLQMYETVKCPQLVLLDFFLYESMQFIRTVSGRTVPIYVWQSGSASACIYRFGPEELGGKGDLAKRLEALVPGGEDSFEKAQEIYRNIHGNLLKIPSIPPMYDYEFSPQILAGKLDAARHLQYVHRLFLESDGSVHCSNPAYEGTAIDAWAKWLPNGPVIAVGPLTTPTELARIYDTKKSSSVDLDVASFLDHALEKYGENSVFYISFGTVFWSSEPEKIWAMIDILLEFKIPFLLAHPSPFAVIPDEMKEEVAKSGLGYMSKWLPQQTILTHKACGWFVSHGGQNSVMESLLAGVPLICWPFESDQPINAVLISMVHNAGYELLEVRNGLALRPMHRLGGRAPEGTVDAVRREVADVFTKARGEDGKMKRRNAQELGEKLQSYWTPGGDGWGELGKITAVLH